MTPTLVRSSNDRLVLHRVSQMAFALGSSLYEMSGHVNHRKQIQTSIRKMQIKSLQAAERSWIIMQNLFWLLKYKEVTQNCPLSKHKLQVLWQEALFINVSSLQYSMSVNISWKTKKWEKTRKDIKSAIQCLGLQSFFLFESYSFHIWIINAR